MKHSVNGLATYNSLLRTHINEFLKKKLKEIENNEILPSHGSLLYIVYKNGGRIQIKDIYDTLLKQKSTITEMIKRLVNLGYLEKETCINDKRVTYVRATEKALKFQPEFNRISDELLEKLYFNFSKEEKDELVRLVFKSIKNFE